MGKAKGDGERVGEEGNGEGDGVRASGDSGIWPTDLRLFDSEVAAALLCKDLTPPALVEHTVLLPAQPVCSLCLRPCKVDGR